MPFFGRSRDQVEGIYLNRMIEQNPVPIIWTCNDVAAIDPAVLRRMTWPSSELQADRHGRASGTECWTRPD